MNYYQLHKIYLILTLISFYAACNKDSEILDSNSENQPYYQLPLDEYSVSQEFGNFNTWANRYHAADEISGAVPWLEPHLHFGIRKGSRFDYPGDTNDRRWMAGYTYAYPADLGWYDPSDYIEEHINK